MTFTLDAGGARLIAAAWRERFSSEAVFEASWAKCFEICGNVTPERLEQWLAQDLERDAARSVGLVKEPLLPVRQSFDLGDCYHCRGRWFVRKDVPVGHMDFGKAFPCPDCNR